MLCTLCVHARLPHSSNIPITRMTQLVQHGYSGELHTFPSSSPFELKENRDWLYSITQRGNMDISTTPADKIKQGLVFGSYLLVWYFFTVVYHFANKNALLAVPCPVSLMWTNLLISTLIIVPIRTVQSPIISRRQLQDMSFLSILYTLSIFLSSLFIPQQDTQLLPHAASPIIMAVISLLHKSSPLSLPTYLTLFPVVVGLALTCSFDPSRRLAHFWLGLLAYTTNSWSSVLIKKYITTGSVDRYQAGHRVRQSPLSSTDMFQVMTVYGGVLLLPVALMVEGRHILPALSSIIGNGANRAPSLSEALQRENYQFRSLLANVGISGVSYYIYNEVSVCFS